MMFNRTILVVDDDRQILEMVGLVLIASGYFVEFATDGEEALEKIGSCAPDLILTDVFMPFMSGLELGDRLREGASTKRIPILAMSGITEYETGEPRKDLPADDFIRKPLQKSELLAKVRALLEPR